VPPEALAEEQASARSKGEGAGRAGQCSARIRPGLEFLVLGSYATPAMYCATMSAKQTMRFSVVTSGHSASALTIPAEPSGPLVCCPKKFQK